jgi:hypothetical protein
MIPTSSNLFFRLQFPFVDDLLLAVLDDHGGGRRPVPVFNGSHEVTLGSHLSLKAIKKNIFTAIFLRSRQQLRHAETETFLRVRLGCRESLKRGIFFLQKNRCDR